MEETIIVYRMEHRSTRKGIQTHLSARYDHGRLNWTLNKNHSIEEVCKQFQYGMLNGCKSLEDLQDWYPACVYMRELMAKHDFVVGVYLVTEYFSATHPNNQLCYFPSKATHVKDYSFDEYLDALDIELERYFRIERRQRKKDNGRSR